MPWTTSASSFASFIAARTAVQRRSSSWREIGWLIRSSASLIGAPPSGLFRPSQMVEQEPFRLGVIGVDDEIVAQHQHCRQLDERHAIALVGHLVEQLA